MVYTWKLPGLYPVPAQTAGEELSRIYQEHGGIEAKTVVEESRPESAPLHPCFEWRDPVAAEKWREHQARNICDCIIVTSETPEAEPAAVKVRAFVHACGTYRPTEVVASNEEMHADYIQSVLQEFRAVRQKHAAMSDRQELKAIFEAIDSATA